MCFALFLYQVVPNTTFVLCFNRDEILARPTKPAHFWSDAPYILGGRDEVRGGTWLGVSTSGRFAFLTNYRETLKDYPTTRGDLTATFLKGTMTPQQYLEQLDGQQYAGFNLIVGDMTVPDFWYTTNRGTDTTPRRLRPGAYGMSNGALDDHWPKMRYGERLAQDMLRQGVFEQPDFPWEHLFQLLSRDEALEGTGTLPDRGRGVAFEQAANCIFMKPFQVQQGVYFGTRSQIVLAAFNESGSPCKVELRERYMLEGDGQQQWAHVANSLTVNHNC